jgi:hypothetical protein
MMMHGLSNPKAFNPLSVDCTMDSQELPLNSHRLVYLKQACPTCSMVQATLAKFDLHAGNIKFNKKNEE